MRMGLAQRIVMPKNGGVKLLDTRCLRLAKVQKIVYKDTLFLITSIKQFFRIRLVRNFDWISFLQAKFVLINIYIYTFVPFVKWYKIYKYIHHEILKYIWIIQISKNYYAICHMLDHRMNVKMTRPATQVLSAAVAGAQPEAPRDPATAPWLHPSSCFIKSYRDL